MKISDMGVFKLLDAIEAWQGNPNIHPLTCGNCSDVSLEGKAEPTSDFVSLSSQEGSKVYLKCPECDYTQENIPECVYQWYIDTHLNHAIPLGQVVDLEITDGCAADAIFYGKDYPVPEGREFFKPTDGVEGDQAIVIGFEGKLRALVVGYSRDCDGTPLYCLSNIRVKYNCDNMPDDKKSRLAETMEYKKFSNFLQTGWSEDSLTVVEGQFVPLKYISIFQYIDELKQSLK
jgi:hypothetical protein